MIQKVATHIGIRENRAGQPRTFVEGTRIRVQDIYAQSEIFGKTPAQIAECFIDLSLAQVHAALSYLSDHREQIVAEFREDEAFANQFKAGNGPGHMQALSRDYRNR